MLYNYCLKHYLWMDNLELSVEHCVTSALVATEKTFFSLLYLSSTCKIASSTLWGLDKCLLIE